MPLLLQMFADSVRTDTVEQIRQTKGKSGDQWSAGWTHDDGDEDDDNNNDDGDNDETDDDKNSVDAVAC